MNISVFVSLIFGGMILFAALNYQEGDLQHFFKNNTDGIVEKKEQIPASSEEKQDQEYRSTIATAFCNVLRKQEKVAIENFNQCVTRKMRQPLEIYKAMTGEQLTKSWENLALNERALVVQEVQLAETKIYSGMAAQESQKSIQAWQKANDDYNNCMTDMAKKSIPWIDQQCPNTDNPIANMQCRSEAIGSTEYKSLFNCKTP